METVIESVFVVLLIAGLWLTRASLFGEFETRDRLVVSTIGTMHWATLLFASFSVHVRTGGEELVAVTMVSVAWLCLVASGIQAAVAIPTAVEWLDNRRSQSDNTHDN